MAGLHCGKRSKSMACAVSKSSAATSSIATTGRGARRGIRGAVWHVRAGEKTKTSALGTNGWDAQKIVKVPCVLPTGRVRTRSIKSINHRTFYTRRAVVCPEKTRRSSCFSRRCGCLRSFSPSSLHAPSLSPQPRRLPAPSASKLTAHLALPTRVRTSPLLRPLSEM